MLLLLIYVKQPKGQIIKLAKHVEGRDHLENVTGVTINQNSGDAYISAQNDSVHKVTPAGIKTYTLFPCYVSYIR